MKKLISTLLPLLLVGCAPVLSRVDQDMFEAVMANNTREVERLLASGAKVNVRNPQEEDLTPLGWAGVWGSKDAAALLVARGADVNAINDHGSTPLIAAVYNGQKEIVEMLLDKGADVNGGTSGGWKPLHKASEQIALEYVARSKETPPSRVLSGNPEVDYQARYPARWKEPPPSRVAAASGIISLLVARGGDVHASAYGIMPIHMAALSGKVALLEPLVAGGADVNSRNNEGVTPLYMSAKDDYPEAAEWLIAHGAEVDCRTKSGFTPLVIAAENGCLDTAKVLIDHGADVRVRGENGLTPLLTATKALFFAHMISTSSPAARKMQEELGRSEVEKARAAVNEVTGRWSEVAILLITHGSDVNIDVGGDSPLYLAAFTGEKGLVEALLDKGADIDYKPGKEFETPLHGAIGEGNEEVAELLISRGANVNSTNMGQKTPLHFLAVFINSRKLAESMIQHRADVNARCMGGRTPLAYAIKAGNTEVAEVLRQHGGTE